MKDIRIIKLLNLNFLFPFQYNELLSLKNIDDEIGGLIDEFEMLYKNSLFILGSRGDYSKLQTSLAENELGIIDKTKIVEQEIIVKDVPINDDFLEKFDEISEKQKERITTIISLFKDEKNGR